MPYTIVKLNPKTYQVIDKESGKTTHLINKKMKDCFAVINTENGKVHAECTSLQNAKAQLRLLYGLESGNWKPTNKKSESKGGNMSYNSDDNEYDTEDEMDEGAGMYMDTEVALPKPQKGRGKPKPSPPMETTPSAPTNPAPVKSMGVKGEQPVPPKETWRTFFIKHAQGKKFATKDDTHEFMKKVGALWTAHKAQKRVEKEMQIKVNRALKRKMKKEKKNA
jgi:hypothetical protein